VLTVGLWPTWSGSVALAGGCAKTNDSARSYELAASSDETSQNPVRIQHRSVRLGSRSRYPTGRIFATPLVICQR